MNTEGVSQFNGAGRPACCNNLDCAEEVPWTKTPPFEGTPTSGYKNVIVEYDIRTEGIVDLARGRLVAGNVQGFGARTDAMGNQITQFPDGLAYRPYHLCKDTRPAFLLDCADCWLMDDVFTVLYTTEFTGNEPYTDQLAPYFGVTTNQGILRWYIADTLPRAVLKLYETGGTRRLNFSMHDATDDNPNFGLWFRSQLDADVNRVYIDNVRVTGIPE